MSASLSTPTPADCPDGRQLHASVMPPFAIYYHPACEQHKVSESHPEEPGRVGAILRALRAEYDEKYFRLAPRVTEEQILRFHTEDHLRTFKNHAEVANRRKSMVSYIDSDTGVMAGTEEAAYRAAGAAVAAVDSIYASEDDGSKIISAFCAVRPPGHHATRSRAMGFCFFNNAAIAARHAQEVYGVDKVAVLDFDVHHGNGTEEGFEDNVTLFYGSTHEKGNFPGTGVEPKFKGKQATKEIDRRIVNRFLDKGKQSVAQFRQKWREIIEEMHHFKPNLVIFSAGFDAHDSDPLADCELEEEDFEWATMLVLDTCRELNPVAPVPCISVLEGGYDLSALASSALVHVRTLFDCSAEIRGEPLSDIQVAAEMPSVEVAVAGGVSTLNIDAIIAAMQTNQISDSGVHDADSSYENSTVIASSNSSTVFTSCALTASHVDGDEEGGSPS